MTYKGYSGSVETSLEDQVLFGTVQFIQDVVVFEGNTLQELRKSFEEAVEAYLAACHQDGKQPDKPASGMFQVRLEPEMHQKLTLYAQSNGIKLNDAVKLAVQRLLSDIGGESMVVVERSHRVVWAPSGAQNEAEALFGSTHIQLASMSTRFESDLTNDTDHDATVSEGSSVRSTSVRAHLN